MLSGGGGDAGVAAVRKDEEGRECFIIGSEYESEYPWPGEEWEEWEDPPEDPALRCFRRRVLDAHVTLQTMVGRCRLTL